MRVQCCKARAGRPWLVPWLPPRNSNDPPKPVAARTKAPKQQPVTTTMAVPGFIFQAEATQCGRTVEAIKPGNGKMGVHCSISRGCLSFCDIYVGPECFGPENDMWLHDFMAQLTLWRGAELQRQCTSSALPCSKFAQTQSTKDSI